MNGSEDSLQRGILVIGVLVSVFMLAGCSRRSGDDVGQEQAIAEAKRAFAAQKAQGKDFTNGPCLVEESIADWSVDIVHNPRQAVDDLPENQCQFYLDGKTHHFVELDLDGNLIRAQ